MTTLCLRSAFLSFPALAMLALFGASVACSSAPSGSGSSDEVKTEKGGKDKNKKGATAPQAPPATTSADGGVDVPDEAACKDETEPQACDVCCRGAVPGADALIEKDAQCIAACDQSAPDDESWLSCANACAEKQCEGANKAVCDAYGECFASCGLTDEEEPSEPN